MKKFWIFLLTSLCFSLVAQAQIKTITNADLEKYRRERLKNDPDDERERQRLGLPSRAEEQQARKRRAMETNEIAEQIRQREAEAQNYWQAQAFDLSSEISAVEAEINYLRARLGEIPTQQTYYAFGYNPYFAYPTYGGVYTRSQIGGRISFGRRSQISIGANYWRSIYGQKYEIAVRRNPARGGYHHSQPGYSGILAPPFTPPSYDNLKREDLLARLRELEQARAGLYARFAFLQDEAHKDGVKID